MIKLGWICIYKWVT